MSKVLSKTDSEIFKSPREKDLLSHITSTSLKYKIWIAVLLVFVVFGLIGYYRQLKFGLVVTAMRDYTSWGIYISNFVFFVAISLVGSLFSSILKLNKNEWSRPLTRISEIIAVSAIICAAVIIIVDMGRPDRFFYVIRYLRIQSPIIWDVIIISTYLVISFLLLYISMLPDLGLCRDRLTSVPRWKKKLYRILALNWNDNPRQWKKLQKINKILAITVLPVAFAIHTITSWLFATTWRPGWDSTNLGPYFVSGAFMAGAAIIIVAMYFIREHMNLGRYITQGHFDKMSKLLVLLSLVYLYFNINEYLGPAFKMVGVEGEHITELFVGNYAPMYWLVQIGGLVLPIILLLFKPLRKPLPAFVISMLVLLGAWFKRFLIVIPSLQHPYLPIQGVDESYLHYNPTWEEWAITISSFAWFLLIITFLVKIFPVIPVKKEEAFIKSNSNSQSDNDEI
ncbi:NrfD/PsrC family molybdoenzyme membrane anchor subunit [Lentiprolixibacter aurantiacus]|uniref:Polysulfide reductase NrfD n=1 Tax=Lentiprolixibacter aurantiacus TaxID=2993939 RepID=A0AAE3MM86_9FLAO|nr:NrfD/PsrC family molybdoenzyme membrane anchor subunit [Lentiprolixibacter aurantiacus]MCX2720380.1 polysulfide reductase NrfD [Lentiprolixibacter aurantiacus]